MIQRTTNYKIFKKLSGNRDIDQTNYRKILNSIKLNNLLECRPILVTENMEVIDGQHRLEVAKALGLEIFYTIKEDHDPKDMILLNTAQKGWCLDDYLNYYASQGNNIFINMKRFCEKNSINANAFLNLIGARGGDYSKKFKNGIFPITRIPIEEIMKEVIDKLKFIDTTIEYIEEHTIGEKLYLKGAFIRRALSSLFSCDGFDESIFMTKLKMNLSRIHPCRTTLEYYDMLKSYYNYRNPDPLP